MADTQASIGYGTFIEMADPATPTVFTLIGEVYKLTPPSESDDSVEATHFLSPGRAREYVPGMSEPGEFEFEINYVPGSTGDTYLQASKGVRKIVRITYPNGARWQFIAIRKGYEPDVPVDDRMSAKVMFKVSGTKAVTAPATPANISVPVISGIAKVGVKLSATDGTWNFGQLFTYQWAIGGTIIANATASTYVPVTGDVGGVLTCSVTCTNFTGAATAISAATAAVIA